MVYPVVFSSSELGWLEIQRTMGILVLGCLNAVLLWLNSGIVAFRAFTLPCIIHHLGSWITCTFSSSEVWGLITWGWFKHPGQREGGVCGPWTPLLQHRLSSGFHGSNGGSAGGFAGQGKSVQPLAAWKELLAPRAWGFFPTQREVALPYECFISVSDWQKPPKILNQSICV